MLYALLFLLDPILCTDCVCRDLHVKMSEFGSVILWGIPRLLADNPGYKTHCV